METGIKVCDAMTKQPFYVGPDTTLAECANLMKENSIGSLLIKNEEELIGILTEEDIVRKAVTTSNSPGMLCARDVMVEGLVTIGAEKDIFDAISSMKQFNIRHLPVTSGKRLIGLLTMRDVLHLEPQIFELLLEKIRVGEAKDKPVNKKPTSQEGICQECAEYTDELKTRNRQLICISCLGV